MNYVVIFKLLSVILWIMAGAFSLCMGVSVYYSSSSVVEAAALPYWVTCVAIAVFLALCIYFPSRRAAAKLYKKEAMCVVGIGWLACAALGALPFMLILGCSVGDAFFESSSGITTTGSSIFSSVENLPRSVLFWRSLSQWIGGLGVVVFFVGILSYLGAGGKILYSNEMGTNSSEMESARVQTGVAFIIRLYMVLSLLCLILFKIFGMGWFDAFCHMFSTVSTGGFGIYDTSFGHFKSAPLEWTAIFFMFLGGVNFAVMLTLLRGKIGRVWRNTELRWYVGVIVISVLSISAVLVDFGEMGVSHLHYVVRTAAFQVVSVMTTTGFCTTDFQTWAPLAHIILFTLMIFGASSGSTAGGLKVARVALGAKSLLLNVEKSFRPHVVRTLRMNAHPVDEQESFSTENFIVLYFACFMVGIIMLSFFEVDLSFEGCITAVASSMSNVGPGLAEVGPVNNYGFMTEASKILLALLMIMGRLEFYAILALFMPSLWRKFE